VAGCGVRRNGDPLCTFFPTHDANFPASGPFTALAINGFDFGCGIQPGGNVVCWGHVAQPPPGPFVRLTAGMDQACALREDGTVACWASSTWPDRVVQACGTFREIAASELYTCGIRPSRKLFCWGHEDNHSRLLNPPRGTFVRVATGTWHACAIRTDGTLACWGRNTYGQSTPPAGEGEFVDVAVGAEHSCALRASGTVACWGNNDSGQASPPPELL
jgi:alpha-tubulin suppressor-like RCC1 family protein